MRLRSRSAAPSAASLARVPRSVVTLPRQVREPFDVYLNGVRQERGTDYRLEGRDLVFDRELKIDVISKKRWLFGSFGFATYRQDDSVDVRYELDGATRVAEKLEITAG